MHRLDRETSGIVLFARSAGVHRAMSLAFQRGEVAKTYLAITRGEMPAEQGCIDVPLHAARRGRARPASSDEPGTKAASLESPLPADLASLLAELG